MSRVNKRPEPPSPARSDNSRGPSVVASPASPTRSAARAVRRPADRGQVDTRRIRLRAPDTMLDRKPEDASLPGYTGHRPGLISEAMCGRSFSYLTGYRRDLLQESALSSEYSKTHGREALRFEPRRFLRSIEDAPRHIILGMDAARSVRPMSAAEARTVKWESKDQFYSILNLSPTGHMPGYRGHVPQYKYMEPGQAYGKATIGRIPVTHASLSAELYRA